MNRSAPAAIPLAAADAVPNDPLLREMLADFEFARTLGYPFEVGNHWSIFRPDFDRIIRTEEIWPRFRRLGISRLFDDTLVFGNGRTEAAYHATTEAVEEVLPWGIHVEAVAKAVGEISRVLGERLPVAAVEQLSECSVGAPQRISVDRFPVDVDWNDLNQIYFALRLTELSGALLGAGKPFVYLEVGGGYGAVGAKLRKLTPGTKVIIVDLPEVLAVQRYYLSKAEPGARIAGAREMSGGPHAAMEEADYLLIPPAQIGSLPNGVVHIAANIRSFMEMPRNTVKFYISEIERLLATGGGFACVNAFEKRTSGEPSRIADYPFDPRWHVLTEPRRLPWQTHILELYLQRLGDSGNLAAVMVQLAAVEA